MIVEKCKQNNEEAKCNVIELQDYCIWKNHGLKREQSKCKEDDLKIRSLLDKAYTPD